MEKSGDLVFLEFSKTHTESATPKIVIEAEEDKTSTLIIRNG